MKNKTAGITAAAAVLVGVVVQTREAIVDVTTGTERCAILNYGEALKVSGPMIPGVVVMTVPRFDLELDCPTAGHLIVKDVDRDEWERLKAEGAERMRRQRETP